MVFEVDTKTVTAVARLLDVLERKQARAVVPPKGAQEAGRRALELVRQGRAGSGFTGVGRARASQLSRGVEMSETTVRRMNNYFSRHAGDRNPDWGKAGEETPGYVAWLAWGGDAGATWAAAQVRKWDREDGKKRFPECLPDGSDVTSVKQVAALLNVDEKVAAFYVLEQKGLPSHMYQEAKALVPPPSSDTGGIAIMFYPSLDDAKQLAIEGGSPAGDLHITLGFFGRADDKNAPLKTDLVNLMKEITYRHEPFDVELNGLARFSGTDDMDPIVVTADSPVLEDIRKDLVQMCEEEEIDLKRNHGYTAHMTMGYVDPESPMPISRWSARTVKISSICLGYGTDYTFLTLGSGEQKDVYSGSLGSPVSSLRTSSSVVDRFAGRVRRIRKKKKKSTT